MNHISISLNRKIRNTVTQDQNAAIAPSEVNRERYIPHFKVRVTPEQNEAIQGLVMALDGKWVGNEHYVLRHLFHKIYLYHNEYGLNYGDSVEIYHNTNLPEYTYIELHNALERLMFNRNVQPLSDSFSPQRDSGFEKLVIRKESSKELVNVDEIINDLKKYLNF